MESRVYWLFQELVLYRTMKKVTTTRVAIDDDIDRRKVNPLTMNVNVSIFETWCRIILISYIYDIQTK